MCNFDSNFFFLRWSTQHYLLSQTAAVLEKDKERLTNYEFVNVTVSHKMVVWLSWMKKKAGNLKQATNVWEKYVKGQSSKHWCKISA